MLNGRVAALHKEGFVLYPPGQSAKKDSSPANNAGLPFSFLAACPPALNVPPQVVYCFVQHRVPFSLFA
jgi:hypothetical protein